MKDLKENETNVDRKREKGKREKRRLRAREKITSMECVKECERNCDRIQN